MKTSFWKYKLSKMSFFIPKPLDLRFESCVNYDKPMTKNARTLSSVAFESCVNYDKPMTPL
jgi:hypothetical protein